MVRGTRGAIALTIRGAIALTLEKLIDEHGFPLVLQAFGVACSWKYEGSKEPEKDIEWNRRSNALLNLDINQARWSTSPPTWHGWYFLAGGESGTTDRDWDISKPVNVTRIEDSFGVRFVIFRDEKEINVNSMVGCAWYGPILIPQYY